MLLLNKIKDTLWQEIANNYNVQKHSWLFVKSSNSKINLKPKSNDYAQKKKIKSTFIYLLFLVLESETSTFALNFSVLLLLFFWNWV